MSFSDLLAVTYSQVPGTTVFSGTITLTGNTQENLDITANANSEVRANISLLQANIQSLLLTCDQDITLKTNSSGAPQDILNVNGNVAYCWTVNLASIFSCPFSNNVTAVFVNNATNVAASFKLRSIANN